TAAIEPHARVFALWIRRNAQEKLIAEWIEHVKKSEAAAAASTLTAIETIGAALAHVTGDTLLVDTARSIREKSPLAQAKLAEAHRQVIAGRDLRDSDTVAALETLRSARATFAAERSPYRFVAQDEIVNTIVRRGNARETLAALDAAEPIPPSYATVALRMSLIRGMALTSAGRPAEALAMYRALLTAAEKFGEPYFVASSHRLLADAYDVIGDVEQAWEHRRAALEAGSRANARDEEDRALSSWTRAAAETYPLAVRVLLDVQLERAEATKTAVDDVETRQARALVAARLADDADRRRELVAFESALQKLPDHESRERATANLTYASMAILPTAEKMPLIEKGIAYALRTQSLFRIPRLRLERGRVRAAEGDRGEAEQEYRAALDELSAQSQTSKDPAVRDSLAQTYGDVFDELIETQLQRNEIGQAFDLAEERRSWMTENGSRSERRAAVSLLESVRRAMPRDAALLEYIVLPRQVVVRVSGVSSAQHSVAITREELRALVGHLLRELEEGHDVTQDVAQLHALFFAPVEKALGEARRLLIVADPPLNAIPFGALRPDGSSRYLVERYAIVGLRCSQQSSGSRGTRRDALLVANPALPRETSGGYAALPGAEREVGRIKRLYDSPTILLDKNATVARFFEEVAKHNIVHVATHAFVNDVRPLQSALLFAGERSGSLSELSVEAIARQSFDRTELVVLAGCETGRPAAQRRHTQAIADAFLRAGVRAVIGTTVKIDDGDSQDVMYALHQELARGKDVIDALHDAQLKVLRADPRPENAKSWAPYQLTVSSL
ncbi:MAG TPA: CHAT domain-containing protein, partial [Thermoanaerobaculia bacterium]